MIKRILRPLAERCARFALVRVFVRALIRAFEFIGKAWGFFRVRAVLSVPVGSSCHWSVQFKYPENISFSGPVMMSPGCVLGAKAPITFGKQVRLSQGVHIETASLDLNSGLPYQHVSKPVSIGDGVWIGAHSIVLGGVTIGANAVIGAGVVVSRSVPPGAIVVGMGVREIARKVDYGK